MSANVLELNEVLGRYAWNRLYTKSNLIKRLFLVRKDYYCEVDWKGVSVDHNIQKISTRPLNTKYKTSFGDVTSGSRWVSLLACDYENQSDSKQSHDFCGKRDTTSWMGVDLKQCYTISGDVDISLNLPRDISNSRKCKEHDVHVSQIKGENFREVLTWEVKSHLDVKPGWRAVAELLALEETHVMDFEITTSLFVNKGKIPVWFKRHGDTSMNYLVELCVDDIIQAFQQKSVHGGVLEDRECRLVNRDTKYSHIQLLTRGSAAMVVWSEQKVDIKTEPMNGKSNQVI